MQTTVKFLRQDGGGGVVVIMVVAMAFGVVALGRYSSAIDVSVDD